MGADEEARRRLSGQPERAEQPLDGVGLGHRAQDSRLAPARVPRVGVPTWPRVHGRGPGRWPVADRLRVLPRLAALCTPASRNRAGDQATHDQHDKFAIFDGRLLVTGSYNWTSSAEAWNYENALFLDDPALIARYAVRFERLLAGPAVTPTGR